MAALRHVGVVGGSGGVTGGASHLTDGPCALTPLLSQQIFCGMAATKCTQFVDRVHLVPPPKAS